MLQNTDSSSLKKKNSSIYMHCNNKLRTYCLTKGEYRMEAYLACIANCTNGKMLAKFLFISLINYLFIYFIYFFNLFIYLSIARGRNNAIFHFLVSVM